MLSSPHGHNIEEFKCEFCGTILPEIRRKYKNQVCNNECRVGLRKVREAEAKGVWEMVKSTKDNGRRCLVCGLNCWPNYFYCNKHHTRKEDGYVI